MSAVPKMADKKSLKSLIPLNGLSNTHFEELARKATILELKPGKFLFKKGERDNATCYILSGEIALHDGSDIKLTIQGGTEEAKHPIAPQQPRQLSARAKTRCTVISIDSGLLDVMLAWEQSAGYEVAEIDSDDEEDWMTRMMQSDLMQRLPANNLQQLFIRMEELPANPGDVIVNQDDDGDYYYIIKDGKCVVSRKPSPKARPVKLAELSDGDSFGEESLLSGSKRNATVTMLTEGTLMRLSKKDFDELLRSPLLSQLSYSDAKKQVDKGAVFLDVRLPGEFANAHLDGSINIQLAAIRNEITKIDRSKSYIVYCDTGRRSTSAVFLMGQFGIDAHVLSGGLSTVPLEEYGQKDEPESADVIELNRDVKPNQENEEALKRFISENEKLQKDLKGLNVELEKLKQQTVKDKQSIVEKEKEVQALQASVNEEQKQSAGMAEELLAVQAQEVELNKLKCELESTQKDVEDKQALLVSLKESEEQAQKKIMSQGEALEKSGHELKQQKSELDTTIARLQEQQESLQREKEALGKNADGSLKALNAEIEGLRSSLDESRTQKDDLEKDLHAERNQAVALRKELESAKDKELDLVKALDEEKADHEKSSAAQEQLMSNEKEDLQAQITKLQEKLTSETSHAQGSIQNYQQQIDDLKEVREQLEREVDASNNQVIELEGNLEQLSEKMSSTVSEMQQKTVAVEGEKENTDKQLLQLKDEKENADKQLLQLKDEKESADKQLLQLEGEVSSKQQENVSLNEALLRLREEKEVGDKELFARLDQVQDELKTASESSDGQVANLQRQLGEVSSERHSLSESVTSLQQELQAVNASKTELESIQKAASDELQATVDNLKKQLEDSEQRLVQADLLANEKTDSGDELRKELVALRAVYAQKEEDVAKLQQELASMQSDMDEYQHKGGEADKEKQAAEDALKQAQEEYEQVAHENSERINVLEKTIEDQQSTLDETRKRADEQASLRTDAESAFAAVESELKQNKGDAENYKSKLEESQLTITTLEGELEKLKQAQQDWRVKENDAAQSVELEFSKGRIKDLEQELKDSQHGMSEARNTIEKLEKDLSMEKHLADTDNNLQGQIEKLKSEMEGQLEKYKTEVDAESSSLRKENAKLQGELDKHFRAQEISVANGSVVEKKTESETKPPPKKNDSRTNGAELDHSELFDLPTIDKNLFDSRVNTQPQKNNIWLVIIVALVFSLASAGGVYWYFVMANKPDVSSAQVISSPDNVETKAVKTPVQGSKPDGKVKTSAKQNKPLFNFTNDKSADKVVAKKDAGIIKPTRVFSDFLKSGGHGPVLVGVPAGVYKMGSPSSSVHFEERPQHTVSVKKFSIAKYEVSFAEYDRFAAATGRPRPSDNGWGRGKRPVVNVSWSDATAYTRWLSRETGHTYRLPTEAEWEYAARAGTKTKYWWGAKVDKKRANCFNCGSQWDRISTAPVGRFEASPLGLHDMSANVMEWVSDCYHKSFDGAPVDGSSWGNGTCDSHVARGGSYRSTAENIRLTKRTKYSKDTALDQLGFRVVRER